MRRWVGIRNFRVRCHGERVYRDRFRIECIVVSIRAVIGVVGGVIAVTIVVETWIHIDIRKSLPYINLDTTHVTVIIACRVE